MRALGCKGHGVCHQTIAAEDEQSGPGQSLAAMHRLETLTCYLRAGMWAWPMLWTRLVALCSWYPKRAPAPSCTIRLP